MLVLCEIISHDGLGAWARDRLPMADFYGILVTCGAQILINLRNTLLPLTLPNQGKFKDLKICHKTLAIQAMKSEALPTTPGAQRELPVSLPASTNDDASDAVGLLRKCLRSDPIPNPHALSDQALDTSDRMSSEDTATPSLFHYASTLSVTPRRANTACSPASSALIQAPVRIHHPLV